MGIFNLLVYVFFTAQKRTDSFNKICDLDYYVYIRVSHVVLRSLQRCSCYDLTRNAGHSIKYYITEVTELFNIWQEEYRRVPVMTVWQLVKWPNDTQNLH